jgi:hypothetical protein
MSASIAVESPLGISHKEGKTRRLEPLRFGEESDLARRWKELLKNRILVIGDLQWTARMGNKPTDGLQAFELGVLLGSGELLLQGGEIAL